MPRIDDALLESTIYLYDSVTAAENGEAAGGTGFLVGVPVPPEYGLPHGAQFVYAVTNAHNIDGGYTYIRVNTRTRGIDVFPTEAHHWTKHPNGDDLAVWNIPLSDVHQCRCAAFTGLVTKEEMVRQRIGPGNEVMVIGRFINVDGKQRNTPAVRFGHISVIPDESLSQRPGRPHDQESIIVECHSISGFSGSPVILYYPEPESGTLATYVKAGRPPIDPSRPIPFEFLVNRATPFKTLGVQWGYVGDALNQGYVYSLHDRTKKIGRHQINTGMLALVPAWKLRELLMEDSLVAKRKKETEDYKKTHARTSGLTSTVPVPEMTRENFESALEQVSKKVLPPDPSSSGT